MTTTEKQHYFDGLFAWVQFVYNAEAQLGQIQSAEQMGYWGQELFRRSP